MISKSKIQFIRSLHDKKGRNESGLFIAEGPKIALEILQSGLAVEEILAEKEWIDAHIRDFDLKNTLSEVSNEELRKISALTNPQQVLLVLKKTENILRKTDLEGRLSLALDGISDPGNLGTIIRIADWFGIRTIVCSEHTADMYNPKTVQASMGSLFRVKILYTGLTDFFEEHSDIHVYGTTLQGENIYTSELTEAGIVLLGNESRGISKELYKYLTKQLLLPSFKESGDASAPAESLNAAIAAALVCAEFRRRSVNFSIHPAG